MKVVCGLGVRAGCGCGGGWVGWVGKGVWVDQVEETPRMPFRSFTPWIQRASCRRAVKLCRVEGFLELMEGRHSCSYHTGRNGPSIFVSSQRAVAGHYITGLPNPAGPHLPLQEAGPWGKGGGENGSRYLLSVSCWPPPFCSLLPSCCAVIPLQIPPPTLLLLHTSAATNLLALVHFQHL